MGVSGRDAPCPVDKDGVQLPGCRYGYEFPELVNLTNMHKHKSSWSLIYSSIHYISQKRFLFNVLFPPY